MKSLLSKDALLKEFYTLKREDKATRYENVIEHHNELVLAFNEVFENLAEKTSDLKTIANSVETINSVLRRLGLKDRVKDIYNLGQTVSNIFWKLHHVQETLSMPQLPQDGEGQIKEQSGDLF